MGIQLKKVQKTNLLLALLCCVIFAEAIVIARLYSTRSDKTYEVNLVKINTEKDSLDLPKLKADLMETDKTVHVINNFLTGKSTDHIKLQPLAEDSLGSTVYLSKQSNRYSQYLADLQARLQTIPLGLPTNGYISSNFGKRKNPIPIKKPAAKPATTVPETPKFVEEKDSLGRVIKRIPAPGSLPEQAKNTTNEVNGSPGEADQMQYHKGLDIAVAYGTDVHCAAKGTVIFAGEKGGYGNCIIISHGNGLDTLYGHLSQILVKVNDVVAVGQVIGKSGNTGRSTGPHLHYEVHKNGTPVNPKLFLNLIPTK